MGIAEAFMVLSDIFTVLVYISPSIAFWHIYRSGSTVGSDPIPCILEMFAASLSIYYGCITHNKTAIIINTVGCFFQIVFIGMYIWYPPTLNRTLARNVLGLFTFLGLVSILGTCFFLSHERETVVAWITSLAVLLSFFGPGAATARAYRKRGAKGSMALAPMSFLLAMMGTMRCGAALVTPHRQHYLLIAITSGVGSVVALFQVIAYCVTISRIGLGHAVEQILARASD